MKTAEVRYLLRQETHRDVNVQATRNQSSSLEEIVIVLFPSCLGSVSGQLLGRWCETTILVDQSQLLNHIIVETIEHDEHDSARWRKCEQSLLRETIRLDLTMLKGSHCVLVFLCIAIQNGEVQIARCFAVRVISMISLE